MVTCRLSRKVLTTTTADIIGFHSIEGVYNFIYFLLYHFYISSFLVVCLNDCKKVLSQPYLIRAGFDENCPIGFLSNLS